MNGPFWRRWLLAALAFALIAALLTWLMPGRNPDLVLVDGRTATVIQTTYGTRHVYEDGSVLAKWVAKLASPAQAQRFGFRTHSTATPTPSVVVWTEWTKSISNRPPRYASLRAISGFETEPVHLAMEFSSPDKSRSVLAWRFENYPRRAEFFEVRFHDRIPPYRPDPLGPVLIQNVASLKVAALGGSEPPLSMVEDGIEFKLLTLTSGEVLPFWRRGTESGLAPWTTATFEVKEGGRVSTNWTIRRISGKGAASNSFSVLYPKVAMNAGRLTPGFASVLWPDEPDWNLSVEFARVRNFRPEDLCTLQGVPVSQTNGMLTTNFLAAVHGGVQVGLNLQRVPAYLGAEGGYLRAGDLALNYTSSVPDLRVELAGVVDDHGRELKFGEVSAQAMGMRGLYTAGLELTADTKTVDLTFAFQRPHRIDFKVKPTFIRTNLPSPFPAPNK